MEEGPFSGIPLNVLGRVGTVIRETTIQWTI